MTTLIQNLFPESDSKTTQKLVAGGILPSEHISAMVDAGFLTAASPMPDGQIQPASVDLRLGSQAYRVRASFLPGDRSTVEKKVPSMLMSTVDLAREGAVLEKGCIYIIRLQESLSLPKGISGVGNPRSTTGRLDVFTRLITDYGSEFDRVRSGYKGPLYAEVVPRTFSVVVREGMRLSQLRFIRGNAVAGDRWINSLNRREPIVYDETARPETPTIKDGLVLSINLRNEDSNRVVGYRAKRNAPAVDFDRSNYYDPEEFWDPVYSTNNGIILDPGDFYILGSKQRVSIPPDQAAEMVALDRPLGEFRIHYAGFFDPGFGYGLQDPKGTPAVLEVRAYDVPFLMEDGQPVCRLEFSRLLEQTRKAYGTSIGSAYQLQGLTLSKQFRRTQAFGG